MSKLKQFLSAHSFQEINLFPDEKYVALRLSLRDYYETYHALRGNYYAYLRVIYNPTTQLHIEESRGHEYIARFFSSISFMHLFFELYIKEILESKERSFVYGKIAGKKEEKNFLNFILNDDFSKFEKGGRTVTYETLLNRLGVLIENDSSIAERFRIDHRYHFLLNAKETLLELAAIRNMIFHQASGVLKKYAFEVLYVNYVLPLVVKFLRLEKQEVYVERGVHCRLNVLNEICNQKLDIDYEDVTKHSDLTTKLRYINHLKELGRASYSNNLYMEGDGRSKEELTSGQEHNRRKRIVGVIKAELKRENFGHYEIHQCPCCGIDSLTTYDIWYNFSTKKEHVQSARCSLCTYKINVELGEPKEFNIMEEDIFVEVREK